MLRFLFVEHCGLAWRMALLFGIGLALSWPVVRLRLRDVAWLPLQVFRLVMRLCGRRPGLVRMTVVIFGFNSVAIFIYMASGFHPLLPRLFAVLTGLNVGLIAGFSSALQTADPALLPAPRGWRPPSWLALLCGFAVLALELPAFWLSLAMGVSMGQSVSAGVVTYGAALSQRAAVYGSLVLPMLLVSAVAESLAISGVAPAGGERAGT